MDKKCLVGRCGTCKFWGLENDERKSRWYDVKPCTAVANDWDIKNREDSTGRNIYVDKQGNIVGPGHRDRYQIADGEMPKAIRNDAEYADDVFLNTREDFGCVLWEPSDWKKLAEDWAEDPDMATAIKAEIIKYLKNNSNNNTSEQI